MSDYLTLSGNFILDPNEVGETGNNVATAMSKADEIVQSAKGVIESVAGLTASVPAKAKCGELISACAMARASLAMVDYMSYGTDIKTTLDALIDAALMADEETAKEINKMIDAMNHTGLKATELTELVRYRTEAGDYSEYLEQVRKVWDQNYDPARYNPEEEREELLSKLKFYGVDNYTQEYSKDPVNFNNGNFIYDRMDISIKALPDIQFKRFYNALDEHVGGFGRGWLHTYEERLVKNKQKITHIKSDAGEELFLKDIDGVYRSILDPENILEKKDDGYILKYPNAGKKVFGNNGKLIFVENRTGQKINCIYNEIEQLVKVCTETGEFLEFNYNEKGGIEKVLDHTGRVVSYTYLENGNLLQASMTDGATYTYDYDEIGRIITVTNPRGVQNVCNQYDEKGRVVRQDFPDGGTMTFSYDEQKRETTLTERNGSKIVYRYDEYKRHIATTDEAGTVRYTYNKFNKKNSVTDRRGNVTKYAYDNKGNLTTVIDPLGNKTCFTYNADSLPSVVKNALGGKDLL